MKVWNPSRSPVRPCRGSSDITDGVSLCDTPSPSTLPGAPHNQAARG
jgi:hypothetical protein